ncbi:lytic transglycosylase [Photobacterium gaetbulicola]|uniref:Lytic transglycosylase n=1 Tax=Photobacterium gaetbulicola TaxID=1295392 RepID=A0A0B9H4K2_9GAMM|nr:lytic transglycosylase [Photobacterium gaetbulicola]
MRSIFLFLFISFAVGCQSIRTVNQSDLVPLTTPVASIQLLSEDAIAQCEIDKRLFKGSFIATGSDTTNAALNHPELSLKSVNPQAHTEHTPDLWDLLASELTIDVPNNRTIRYYKRWYVNNPYHIEKVTARAEPFLYYIYQQVNARGLPIELVLLPFVESSFDQFAYSHKGAAGLWQITEPTGKAFGLDIIKGYDGRRDIVYSTEAALDLLEYLYDKFNQDWLHAIAAYNTGGARVRAAIKQNKQAGKSTDFWSLQLPKETRHYLPKLLAMADLVKHHSYRYEIPLHPIQAKPVLEEITISRKVKLGTVATFSGLSSKELYHYNPGYTAGYTRRDKDNKILMPLKNKTLFFEHKHASNYAKQHYDVIDIKVGDSLNQLAQTNNISVDLIKQVNHLSDATIFAGQKLLIPKLTNLE